MRVKLSVEFHLDLEDAGFADMSEEDAINLTKDQLVEGELSIDDLVDYYSDISTLTLTKV